MLTQKLKEWTYYKQKLPLYIQSSYGMLEYFKTIYDLLKQVDDTEDSIHASFTIMSINVDKCKNGDEKELAKIKSDVLDKIGNLLNISRLFSFTYIEEGTKKTYDTNNNQYVGSDGLTHHGLDDVSYLRLLQIKVLMKQFIGTYKSLRSSYMITLQDNKFDIPIYIIANQNPATCDCYLVLDTESSFSDIEKKMFMAGLYTPNIIGITYIFHIVNSNLAVWDTIERTWDIATWG